MTNNLDYKAAYERQKLARLKAENILETRSFELYEKNQSLLLAYNKLKDQKAHMLHQEKLASIGQLSAGVAHEINNPTGFVKSNLHSLQRYIENLKSLIAHYDECFSQLHTQDLLPKSMLDETLRVKKNLDVDFLLSDLNDLTTESLTGLSRIEDIVKSLKSFARPDSQLSELFNLNSCIENTLKLVWNEIKYKAEVTTDLGDIPDTLGYPGEISQVILNLVVNAAHAIEASGTISIDTRHEGTNLIMSITDDGCGIEDDHMHSIFDPFFTTKDIDSGTGLGLSITHGIVKKHKGSIEVTSEIGKGTSFKLTLPILS